MVKIPNMLVENEDYQLVPGEEDHWNIRILKGDFIECVISFGKIRVDEKNHQLKFDFTLHYSPDPDLNVDDLELQKHAASVLESVMINSLENQ